MNRNKYGAEGRAHHNGSNTWPTSPWTDALHTAWTDGTTRDRSERQPTRPDDKAIDPLTETYLSW